MAEEAPKTEPVKTEPVKQEAKPAQPAASSASSSGGGSSALKIILIVVVVLIVLTFAGCLTVGWVAKRAVDSGTKAFQDNLQDTANQIQTDLTTVATDAVESSL